MKSAKVSEKASVSSTKFDISQKMTLLLSPNVVFVNGKSINNLSGGRVTGDKESEDVNMNFNIQNCDEVCSVPPPR